MTTGTCKDCEFWGKQSIRAPNYSIGACDSPKWDGQDGAYPDVDGVKTFDETFYTGPDFGCIHFERKPKQEGGG